MTMKITKKHWKNSKKANNTVSLYGPLKDLSDLLFYAISASILTAIAQMTVGLYPHILATLLSLFTSVLATLLLIASLKLIKQNLNIWFTYIDKQE